MSPNLSTSSYMNSTIAAVATPPGEGGIAVIRISGPQALAIAAQIFQPLTSRSNKIVEHYDGYSVHYGVVGYPPVSLNNTTDQLIIVDDVILTVFKNPKSYTGEDVCEIACHGGSASTTAVLTLVLTAGAKLAEPGEFTRRAFMNGRMDLAQAEAVAALIRAKTDESRKAARRQLNGDFSLAVHAIRHELIGAVASIEVTIDFSDEAGDLNYTELLETLNASLERVIDLQAGADRGRVLREGRHIAIIGRPNVGKSALLNALLKTERAIVTPLAGTTRDTIEESLIVNGIPIVLIDTAGIRDTIDEVETIGIERSTEAARNADVCALVLDASVGIQSEDVDLFESAARGGETLIVLNKCDLVTPQSQSALTEIVAERLRVEMSSVHLVSALNRVGMEALERSLADPSFGSSGIRNSMENEISSSTAPSVGIVRHIQALQAVHISIRHAIDSTQQEMPGDFIAIDIRGALDSLGLITGQTVTDDIIHRIFADFCVGK